MGGVRVRDYRGEGVRARVGRFETARKMAITVANQRCVRLGNARASGAIGLALRARSANLIQYWETCDAR